MNVYDFDNTILHGDSSVLFIRHCIARHPSLIIRLFGQIFSGLSFLMKKKEKQAFKEGLFTALMPNLKNPEAEIEAFWNRNIHRAKPFYSRTRKRNDVIISASPEFLIIPACRRLGIKYVMASPVDARTGKYLGPNCHGEEKVRRFRQKFPNASIECFYSDSHSDDPLARLAEQSFMVKGHRILPWDEKQ